MSSKQVVTRPGGTPKWVRDATTNDSDKTFTVPTGKEWDIRMISANIVCTATVGNRNLVCLITDGTNAILAFGLTANITASNAGVLIAGPMVSNSTTLQDYPLYTGFISAILKAQSIPEMTLKAGYTVRIYDISAVDAAADDLTVVLHYIEYEA